MTDAPDAKSDPPRGVGSGDDVDARFSAFVELLFNFMYFFCWITLITACCLRYVLLIVSYSSNKQKRQCCSNLSVMKALRCFKCMLTFMLNITLCVQIMNFKEHF